MKIVLVSKCFLDIEQHVEFKMSVLISPSKSLISSRWVTITIHSYYSLHMDKDTIQQIVDQSTVITNAHISFQNAIKKIRNKVKLLIFVWHTKN